jgi:superfamily II DNA/RNA helicase
MKSIQPASLPRAVAGTHLIVQAKTRRGKVTGMDVPIGDQDARKYSYPVVLALP